MTRQAAEHVRNRAERLRKSAERRRCPSCNRGGGLSTTDRFPSFTYRYVCRYCGHWEITKERK